MDFPSWNLNSVSSKWAKTVNMCIIKADVEKEPKHVTLLSQHDASGRERQQGQVLSWEKHKKWTPVGMWHIPHSHVVSTCARVFPVHSSPSHCETVSPKYHIIGLKRMSGLDTNDTDECWRQSAEQNGKNNSKAHDTRKMLCFLFAKAIRMQWRSWERS